MYQALLALFDRSSFDFEPRAFSGRGLTSKCAGSQLGRTGSCELTRPASPGSPVSAGLEDEGREARTRPKQPAPHGLPKNGKIERSARPTARAARAHIHIRHMAPFPTRSAPRTAHAPCAAAARHPLDGHPRIRQIRPFAPPCGSKFRSPAARACPRIHWHRHRRSTCVGAHHPLSRSAARGRRLRARACSWPPSR